jgi:hypothetical protein
MNDDSNSIDENSAEQSSPIVLRRQKIARLRWYYAALVAFFAWETCREYHMQHSFSSSPGEVVGIVGLIWFIYFGIKAWWSTYVVSDIYDPLLLPTVGIICVIVGVATGDHPAAYSGLVMILKSAIDLIVAKFAGKRDVPTALS